MNPNLKMLVNVIFIYVNPTLNLVEYGNSTLKRCISSNEFYKGDTKYPLFELKKTTYGSPFNRYLIKIDSQLLIGIEPPLNMNIFPNYVTSEIQRQVI